ncbi:hypothetical protein [Nocardioides speluncae]|uniref:hypothetical protein n=1 Tax=Nocardioides speluncae TaxID=2670337 RepID=UPI000D68EBB0|nr:hypothetical protein [Nocardioides speluncae]
MSTPVAPPARIPSLWSGFIDDAAIFPPGNSPLPDAIAAHLGYRASWYADLVGPLVVKDTDLPSVTPSGTQSVAVSVVLTGGAGAIAGAAKLAGKAPRTLAALEVALRDPDDLVGGVRRVAVAVDAARSEGVLDFDTPIYVELPNTGYFGHWGDPIDVLVEHDFRLKLRTGGLEADLFPEPAVLADWLDLAQAHAIPFKCTAGLHRAVRHTGDDGFDHHGFLNILVATAQYLAGASVPDARATLEQRDSRRLLDDAASVDLTGARRWFTSYGSCSIAEPLDDLMALGLVTGATEGDDR